jgi:hypothetical protein
MTSENRVLARENNLPKRQVFYPFKLLQNKEPDGRAPPIEERVALCCSLTEYSN